MTFVVLANLHAAYLAADGLGQLVHKLDDARILVGRGLVLHVVLQLLHQLVALAAAPRLAQHDGGLDHHAANLVGHARYGALHDGGVGHQRALHLKRAYAVAAALYHVVDAAHEPVVAVLVAPRLVAGVVDAVVPDLARKPGVAVVLLEQADGLAAAIIRFSSSV